MANLCRQILTLTQSKNNVVLQHFRSESQSRRNDGLQGVAMDWEPARRKTLYITLNVKNDS
eukprot:537994-Amphidinium_carterae.1